MGNKQQSCSAFSQLLQIMITLLLKEHISDSQSFINDQQIRFNHYLHRKSKADHHAAGISLYRLINKFANICKIDDRLIFRLYLLL